MTGKKQKSIPEDVDLEMFRKGQYKLTTEKQELSDLVF